MTIPDDFRPSPLGPRSEVIREIRRVIWDVDFTDSSWGILDRPTLSIGFNMGSEDVCGGFMLHVRGGGDAKRLHVGLEVGREPFFEIVPRACNGACLSAGSVCIEEVRRPWRGGGVL